MSSDAKSGFSSKFDSKFLKKYESKGIAEGSTTHRVLASLNESDEEHSSGTENGELWLVSYSDLMTLLFGFFVMMYSDSARVQDIKKTFESSSGVQLTEKQVIHNEIENIAMKDQLASLETELKGLKEQLQSKEAQLKNQAEKLRIIEAPDALAVKEKIETLQNENTELKAQIELAHLAVKTAEEKNGALSLQEIQTRTTDRSPSGSQSGSWSENAITEQARLLFRAPCRVCVAFSGVSSDVAGKIQTSRDAVVATHVTRGGPAELAGMRSGDVIEKIEGRSPRDRGIFESFTVGQVISIEIKRFGEKKTLKVKLDAMSPKAQAMLDAEKTAPSLDVGKFKVSAIGLRERITHYIPSEVEGVIINKTCSQCGPQAWRVSEGDVIVSINGELVKSPDQLNQIWLGASVVEVWRSGVRDFELVQLSPG